VLFGLRFMLIMYIGGQTKGGSTGKNDENRQERQILSCDSAGIRFFLVHHKIPIKKSISKF
jgi:hypothetical protein